MTGFQAKLLREPSARALVGLQGFRLTTRAVQGQHQLGMEPLADRMLCGERLQFGTQRRVTAENEVGIDSILDRLQAQVL